MSFGIEHKGKKQIRYKCINHIFDFCLFVCLYSEALTSGALLTLEGEPLPELANSRR